MMAFVAALPPFLLGWIIVRLLLAESSQPTWLRWLSEICLGTALGAGLTSCLYFVLVAAGVASRITVLACEVPLLAVVAFLLIRREKTPANEPKPNSFSWIWILRAAAIVALCTFALDYWQGITASPNGEYDAVTIWNLRARYLAGGAPTWRYAVSGQMAAGMTGASHPGYPLLVSAFVARTWTLVGETPSEFPATMSLVFTLAALGLLCSAIGESAGLLAVLVLLATESFVSQAASQYADIPLSLYILATVALLALAEDRQWPAGTMALAGMFAGLAAWTKNEGLPFVILACLVALWRGGLRSGAWMVLGAVPGVAMTALLKFVLSTGSEKMFPNGPAQALGMIASPSRWFEIAASFARNFVDLGVPWAHPLLLLAVLALALGFVTRQEMQARLWLLLPVAGLMAADFGIYLISTTGLGWQLSTSNNRLIVQVWPALLFTFFLMLRPPASAPQAAPPPATSKKQRRQPSRA